MPPVPEPKRMNLRQFAQYLDVPPWMLRDWIQQYNIPTVRWGSSTFVEVGPAIARLEAAGAIRIGKL
jgi:hypothetical protein